MKRRAFNFAAGVSLVLCVAAVVLWVRSYWQVDGVGYSWADNESFRFAGISLGTENGKLDYRHSFGESRTSPATMPYRRGYSYYSHPARFHYGIVYGYEGTTGDHAWLGFGYNHLRERDGPYVRSANALEVVVPLWCVLPLLALIPARWAWVKRREFLRARVGRCPGCGYDMRATPERCPECGASPASTVS